jgi:glycerophosphoryl diester phosphodiesterase
MKSNLLIIGLLIHTVGFSQGKIIAHRGASSLAPENTLVSFEKAIELGVDYIELDIRLSADDSVMVIHDETLERTTNGSGRVDALSYEALKKLSAGYESEFGNSYGDEKIPTLMEVLKLAKGKVKVCIDMKNVPETSVVVEVEKVNMAEDVVLMSYNIDKLKRLEDLVPKFKTVLINNNLTSIDIELAQKAGAFAVSGSWVSNPLLIKTAHNKGLEFWVGIIADPAKAQTLFDLGVAAVVTKHPQRMVMSRSPMFGVFPNPFEDYIILQLKSPSETILADIIDQDGKIIYRFPKPYESVMQWQPGEHVKSGWYLIFIIQNREVMVGKILYHK